MAPVGLLQHHARKVIKVGCSFAVVIPPHVLDHLGAQPGDFLIWDLNLRNFALLSRAPVPPYATVVDTETGETKSRRLAHIKGDFREFIGDRAATRVVIESCRDWSRTY